MPDGRLNERSPEEMLAPSDSQITRALSVITDTDDDDTPDHLTVDQLAPSVTAVCIAST